MKSGRPGVLGADQGLRALREITWFALRATFTFDAAPEVNMTIQAAEILAIEQGAVTLPAMKLYGIIVGDVEDSRSCAYTFINKGNPEKMTMCTALWRGYVSAYRLRSDGTLVLERFEYPYTEKAEPDEVSEILRGDFWLDLREWFMGDAVYVPFRDGKIVPDQNLWKRRSGIPAMGTRR